MQSPKEAEKTEGGQKKKHRVEKSQGEKGGGDTADQEQRVWEAREKGFQGRDGAEKLWAEGWACARKKKRRSKQGWEKQKIYPVSHRKPPGLSVHQAWKRRGGGFDPHRREVTLANIDGAMTERSNKAKRISVSHTAGFNLEQAGRQGVREQKEKRAGKGRGKTRGNIGHGNRVFIKTDEKEGEPGRSTPVGRGENSKKEKST